MKCLHVSKLCKIVFLYYVAKTSENSKASPLICLIAIRAPGNWLLSALLMKAFKGGTPFCSLDFTYTSLSQSLARLSLMWQECFLFHDSIMICFWHFKIIYFPACVWNVIFFFFFPLKIKLEKHSAFSDVGDN